MSHDPPDISTAHDVRHLCVCQHCREIGDDRKMIETAYDEHMHGDCAFRALSDLIFYLPTCELEKFTLGDVGPDAMRKLILIAGGLR
jgi:hypothetical protein